MGKQYYTNKAYTLVEMLVVLLVISTIMVITESRIMIVENDVYENEIVDEILMKQLEVIMNDESDSYDNGEFEIYYSHLGNTNKAQTIYINSEEYIVSLGTAKIYKK